MNQFDVLIVGGGTSGLMAACSAAQAGARVAIVEKNPSLGRKLLLTGGTRCNVTNRRFADEVIAHIPGNGRFLYSAFHQFDNQDIITFFESRGVNLKEEDHGRMFPVTDSAKTILSVFEQELARLNVHVFLSSPVKSLRVTDGRIVGVETVAGRRIDAQAVVLAMGGKSVPKTGSTGDAYPWLRAIGHTITPLFATEVPLLSHAPFIQSRELQGLSLRDVAVSVRNTKDKAIVTHRMDMIFTHFGISGPAVLRCSSFAHQVITSSPTKLAIITIDAVPQYTHGQLQEQFDNNRDLTVKTLAKQWVPERYIVFLLGHLGIDEHRRVKQLTPALQQGLINLLKRLDVPVHGSLPIEKGFVTGGGVKISEINPQTMASKIVAGLYFCGELIDIHGYTGGYNITAAFVTGHVAGMHAAWQSN